MEEFAVFLVSLSYTEEGQLRGRLKTLSGEDDYEFGDLAEAVLKIEELLDRHMGPRPSPLRQFEQAGGIRRDAYLPASKGKGPKNQFCIRIYYRQHDSWQGEIRWQDGEQRMYFHSVLELLKLIKSAALIPQI